jgi:UDP-glucose 4-epimerase
VNILLTGGAGYIGSHAAVALAEAGHSVIILDNFCNSNLMVLQGLKKILNKEVVCVQGDIRDTALVTQVLNQYFIDAVIHFAGLKAVSESVKKPIEYYGNNVQGAISLIQAMGLARVKTLVFSSSATVYGDPKYLPIDEMHPLSTTNPYGQTKLHVEELLKDVAMSDAGWKILCLRYFNPIGAHESGLIGEKPDGIPNNLVPYISQVAIGDLPHLNIYGSDYETPDGTGVRDYIHVVDLADAHLASINSLGNRRGWDAINIGTGRGYSVMEVVDAYRKATLREIPYVFSPRRSGDIASCYASCEKAKRVLGWSAKRNLAQMCISSWKWINNHTY